MLTFAISAAPKKDEATPLQMGLLFGIGLLLGLAIGPTLNAYASLEGGGTIIAQAAGATALFMGVLGTVGYLDEARPDGPRADLVLRPARAPAVRDRRDLREHPRPRT